MGVLFLDEWMQTHSKFATMSLRGKRVLVDGPAFSNYICDLIKAEFMLGGNHKSIVDSLEGLLHRCKEAGVSFVFVFDGIPESIKSTELHVRTTARVAKVADAMNWLTLAKPIHVIEHMYQKSLKPRLMSCVIKEVLRHLRYPVIMSDGENDGYLTALAHDFDCVLGSDSDFYILAACNPKMFYMPMSTFNLTNLEGKVYHQNSILQSMGISSDIAPFVACLIGNDYFDANKILALFHKKIRVSAARDRVSDVLAWVKQNNKRKLQLQHAISKFVPDTAETKGWQEQMSKAQEKYHILRYDESKFNHPEAYTGLPLHLLTRFRTGVLTDLFMMLIHRKIDLHFMSAMCDQLVCDFLHGFYRRMFQRCKEGGFLPSDANLRIESWRGWRKEGGFHRFSFLPQTISYQKPIGTMTSVLLNKPSNLSNTSFTKTEETTRPATTPNSPVITFHAPGVASSAAVVTLLASQTNQSPTIPANQPPLCISQPPLSTNQQPSLSTGQSPLSTNHPPFSTNHPPLSTSQPPLSTNHPPLSTSQPPLSTSQPPLFTNQPPNITKRLVLLQSSLPPKRDCFLEFCWLLCGDNYEFRKILSQLVENDNLKSTVNCDWLPVAAIWILRHTVDIDMHAATALLLMHSKLLFHETESKEEDSIKTTYDNLILEELVVLGFSYLELLSLLMKANKHCFYVFAHEEENVNRVPLFNGIMFHKLFLDLIFSGKSSLGLHAQQHVSDLMNLLDAKQYSNYASNWKPCTEQRTLGSMTNPKKKRG